MIFVNKPLFNAQVNASANSAQIDSSQIYLLSVQAFFSDAAAAGTLKVQVSNDHTATPGSFTVVNWSDLSGASVVVAAGATVLIPTVTMCYRWMRLVWTRTAGAGTFTATYESINI